MRCVLHTQPKPFCSLGNVHFYMLVQELMAYVGAAFGSANADVRGAALRVAVVAAESAGAAPVRRLLPQGINPKMKEQVEQALGLDPSAPQSAGELLCCCSIPVLVAALLRCDLRGVPISV